MPKLDDISAIEALRQLADWPHPSANADGQLCRRSDHAAGLANVRRFARQVLAILESPDPLPGSSFDRDLQEAIVLLAETPTTGETPGAHPYVAMDDLIGSARLVRNLEGAKPRPS